MSENINILMYEEVNIYFCMYILREKLRAAVYSVSRNTLKKGARNETSFLAPPKSFKYILVSSLVKRVHSMVS